MLKRWISLILCLCLMLCITACGKKKEAPRNEEMNVIQEQGTLRIGVTQAPPYSVKGEDGKYSGFDIELATRVCQKLELKPEFVEVAWSDRMAALMQGRVDCLWSGLTAVSQLRETVEFSQTYLASKPVLVVLQENAEDRNFSGKNVAAEVDSACQSAVKVCLPESKLLAVENQMTALKALQEGKAAAAVVDRHVALRAAAQSEDLLILEDVELGSHEMAVAMRINSDLIPAVNKALTELEQEGVMNSLAETYGMNDSLIVG